MPDVAFACRKKSEAVPGQSAAALQERLGCWVKSPHVQFVLTRSRRLIAGKNVMNAVGATGKWRNVEG